MQKKTPIRHAQRQRNKKKNDGREPQRKPHDKADGCWTTRVTIMPENTDSKQYMESTDSTTTSATTATDRIQHDATTYDATTDDAYSATAVDGNEPDADAPNAIWITTTSKQW